MEDKSKNNQSFNLINEGLDDFLSDSRFKDNEKYASTLLAFAWFIEIVAVCIGIIFAASTLTLALEGRDITRQIQLNALMGALPWVAAALAELTKIPLAIGFYRTTLRSWKIAFGMALILLSFITFETMFGGLERNYTLQNYSLTTLQAKINNFEERKNDNEQKIDELENTSNESINEEYNKENTDNINEELNEKQILKEESDYNINRLNESLLLIQQGDTNTIINNLKDRIKAEKENLEIRIAQVTEQERLNYRRAKETHEKTLESFNREEREAINEPIFPIFNDRRVKNRYRELREEERDRFQTQTNIFNANISQMIENENNLSSIKISELDKKIEQESSLINNPETQLIRSSEIKDEIENLENNYQLNFKSITEKFRIKKEKLDKRISNKREILEKSQETIVKLRNENTSLDQKITTTKEDLTTEMNNSQVYRLTHRFFNSDDLAITEVNQKTANLVAIFWFGSIAFLIAVMGVILALCSQNMRDINSFANKELSRSQKTIKSSILDILKSFSNLITSFSFALVKLIYGIMDSIQKFFRNANAAIWKRMRKPKIKIKYEDREIEVPVKVPVEVPVEKIVEKEVIKWKTRIVQVPLFSSHPGLIDVNTNILAENAIASDGLNSLKKDDTNKNENSNLTENNLSSNSETIGSKNETLASNETTDSQNTSSQDEDLISTPILLPNTEFKDLGFHPLDGIKVSIRVGSFSNLFLKHGEDIVPLKIEDAQNINLENAVKILTDNSVDYQSNNND